MQKQEELQDKLEQLEKEIWFLIKTTLPELREELSHAGGGADKEKIAELEKKINETTNRVNEAMESITNINAQLENLENTTQNHGVELENVKASAIENSTNINRLQTSVSNNSSNINSSQSSVSNNTSNISNNASNISNISGNLTNLTNRVTTLENRPSSSGGGRVMEVIYDMKSEDANINLGYTSGLLGNTTINWTGEGYDFLRIYGVLNNLFSYIEIPLNNRLKNDFILYTVGLTGKVVHYLKGAVLPDKKQFAVGLGFTYTFNSTSNEMSFASSFNTKYYISRIEGIKGV